MSKFEVLKSRILPLAAIGAATLSLAGCRACGWADSQTFTMGCPADAPSAKIKRPPVYTDMPDSYRNTLEVEVFCLDEASGSKSAPLQIEAGSQRPEPSENGERFYEFTVAYAGDVEAPPVSVKSISVNNPDYPNAGIVTLVGMYDSEGVFGPDAVGTVK